MKTIKISCKYSALLFHSEVMKFFSDMKKSGVIKVHGKGIGIVAIKTCTGGIYSPLADIEQNFGDNIKWVLQQKFITSTALAITNFESVDVHTS